MEEMDTTLNYQALALDIVMTAIGDAQGEGEEAMMASQWLEHVDFAGLGIEGTDIADLAAFMNIDNL